MSNIALASIIFGTAIIITRAPFILAPTGSLNFYIKVLFSSNTRTRILGILLGLTGAVMIWTAQGQEQKAAFFIKYCGWFLTLWVGPILLIFTSVFRDIFFGIVHNLDSLILRFIGIISIGIGTVFVYIGLKVL